MKVKFYVGRFGDEQYLFENDFHIPNRGDFIFYNEVTYKVLYTMYDYDNSEVDVFLRESIEEDF